jgi:hypothetical protein
MLNNLYSSVAGAGATTIFLLKLLYDVRIESKSVQHKYSKYKFLNFELCSIRVRKGVGAGAGAASISSGSATLKISIYQIQV